MCGINGQYVLTENQTLDHADAERVSARLIHRGPEQSGRWSDERAFLGHRRLVLVDECGGTQPMAGERVVLAYNGEIYNHHELRSELTVRGHRFKGRSDTEVVLAAFQIFGDAAWSRLNGMYSAAVYDRADHSLRLTRDPFGIKPMYYAAAAGRVHFASEPGSLAAATDIDRAGLLHFLRFAQPAYATRTIFDGVKAVQPGELIKLRPGQMSAEEVNPVRFPAPAAPLSENTTKATLRHLLRQAVERQVVADAPVGLFLSGGVDSAVLACLLKQVQQAAPRTFTVALADDESELPPARLMADSIGCDHTELRVTVPEYFAAWRELTRLRGLPVCYPNEVLIFALAREASKSVKLALTGEGADELFGGYSHIVASLTAFLAGTEAANLHRPLLLKSLAAEFRGADLTSPSRFFASITAWWPLHHLLPLLRPAYRDTVLRAEDEDPYAAAFAQARALPPDAAARYVLMHVHLPNLLGRLDGATMAASLEGRVPYTDRDLVDFVSALPPLRNGRVNNKEILRSTFADLIPDSIRRRPKRPFDASLHTLFASTEGQQALQHLSQSESLAEIFEMDQLRVWLDRNPANVNLQQIWLLVSLNQWLTRNIN
ncbi:asparagine synthase (glutamine-hydrolyzing) [candidate division KSB1 bacterium]|nr:asparagine synthase (glutamine-hydrolyzing) [candidate division KSB1 bacterium]